MCSTPSTCSSSSFFSCSTYQLTGFMYKGSLWRLVSSLILRDVHVHLGFAVSLSTEHCMVCSMNVCTHVLKAVAGFSSDGKRTIYRISRRISRVSGHQNRGQKIDLNLYEGHIISVVRLLIKNLACLAICSF